MFIFNSVPTKKSMMKTKFFDSFKDNDPYKVQMLPV